MTQPVETDSGHINTSDGQCSLFFKSWKPSQKSIATVTFVHGLGEHCSRYEEFFNVLAGAGITVNSFDHRGHGYSKGKRGHLLFSQAFEDITLIAGKADKNLPHFLFGHSMGGGMVLSYVLDYIAHKRTTPHITGVVASGAMLRSPTVESQPFTFTVGSWAAKLLPALVLSNEIKFATLTRDTEEQKKYAEDKYVHDKASLALIVDMVGHGKHSLSRAAQFSLPILVVHGEKDVVTDPLATMQFFELIPTTVDKEMKIYQDCMHELHFELEPTRREYLNYVRDWLLRHIEQNNTTAATNNNNNNSTLPLDAEHKE